MVRIRTGTSRDGGGKEEVAGGRQQKALMGHLRRCMPEASMVLGGWEVLIHVSAQEEEDVRAAMPGWLRARSSVIVVGEARAKAEWLRVETRRGMGAGCAAGEAAGRLLEAGSWVGVAV